MATNSGDLTEMRSSSGYWLGAAMLTVAALIGAGLVLTAVLRLNRGISEPTPIEIEHRIVELDAGSYVVYDEEPTYSVRPLAVGVLNAASGRPVDLVPALVSARSVGETPSARTALATFTIEIRGEYLVDAGTPGRRLSLVRTDRTGLTTVAPLLMWVTVAGLLALVGSTIISGAAVRNR